MLLEVREQPPRSAWAEAALFWAIGVYVGFIQAGMGLLLLLAMSWFHARELIGANAVKNAIGLVVTVAGLLVFVYYGQVHWRPGLIMAFGNLLGGFVGARMAIRRGEKFIYGFLIVVMVLTGLKLLIG